MAKGAMSLGALWSHCCAPGMLTLSSAATGGREEDEQWVKKRNVASVGARKKCNLGTSAREEDEYEQSK